MFAVLRIEVLPEVSAPYNINTKKKYLIISRSAKTTIPPNSQIVIP